MNIRLLLPSAVLVLATLSAAAIAADNISAIGRGVINSLDTSAARLNLSHEAIKDLGWPAMTMDFDVAPEVELDGLKPGQTVTFTLVPAPDGILQIKRIWSGDQ